MLIFLVYGIFAQSFQGHFFIATSNGEVTLSLSSQDDINFSGKMIGDEGSEYVVVAHTENEGGILGSISRGDEELGFAAYPNDQVLYVVLMPVGVDGEPDMERAQKFAMNRRGTETVNSPKAAGPLMNASAKNTWDGNYVGDINGTTTSLIIQQEGSSIQGKIDAEGYIYNISGNLENNLMKGELSDPQTQGKMSCSGSKQDGVILLTMSDESTGQSFQLTYSRKDPDQNNTANSQNGNVSVVNENVERDPNLVGNWIYSNSYTSGSFSFASQVRFIVNPDGTYLYGDSKMAGGDAGSSVQSGEGDWERGQWKTQNKTIYTNEGAGWQPYAEYYVEGNSMMMKFSDGSKQIWKR